LLTVTHYKWDKKSNQGFITTNAKGRHPRSNRARCHEDIGNVVLSDSGVCLPCASARLTSAVGDGGTIIECRGVVSWLSLRGYSPNGKLVQLTPESRSPEGPFAAGSTTASSALGGKTLSTCFVCGASSMTDKTLRSFDSALRVFVSGGDDGRFGCRGGDNDRGFVGLLRSELDVDGTASAHSDTASE
jgi:hypothetical protein